MIPADLYHYYECSRRPFYNLSDLPLEEAERIQTDIRERSEGFAGQRNDGYLTIRFELERLVRERFIAKGGQPMRMHPHYMVLGACDWVKSWYLHGCQVHLALSSVAPESVSFTYGDTFPAMRYADGKPYRKQVYRLAELPDLVAQYGLPQDWNADGMHGPDRYIEAQIRDDEPLRQWLWS
jgi:hypothetical protein